MTKENLYAFKKEVDWSLLLEGLTIPAYLADWITGHFPQVRTHGSKHLINIILNDKIFQITLSNLNFKQVNYPNRSDIFQFRYSTTSDFVAELRSVFQNSYDYILQNRVHGRLNNILNESH